MKNILKILIIIIISCCFVRETTSKEQKDDINIIKIRQNDLNKNKIHQKFVFLDNKLYEVVQKDIKKYFLLDN